MKGSRIQCLKLREGPRKIERSDVEQLGETVLRREVASNKQSRDQTKDYDDNSAHLIANVAMEKFHATFFDWPYADCNVFETAWGLDTGLPKSYTHSKTAVSDHGYNTGGMCLAKCPLLKRQAETPNPGLHFSRGPHLILSLRERRTRKRLARVKQLHYRMRRGQRPWLQHRQYVFSEMSTLKATSGDA